MPCDEIEHLYERFASLLEVAEDLRCYTTEWDWKYGDWWDAELEKAREVTKCPSNNAKRSKQCPKYS